MTKFTDRFGRDWEVEISPPTIARVRELLNVDLASFDFKAFEQLHADPCLLVNVIYVLCKPQCDERDVTDEKFGSGLAGDPITCATDALLKSLYEFLPAEHAKLLRASVERHRDIEQQGFDRAIKKLSDPKERELAIAAIESQHDEEIIETLKRLKRN